MQKSCFKRRNSMSYKKTQTVQRNLKKNMMKMRFFFFSEEIEVMKKDQTEILELKTSIK